MDIRKVTDTFSVAPQIEIEELAEVAALGFKSVICNRPDGEEMSQPETSAMKAAAEEAGLTFSNVPVISGAMTLEDVKANAAALEALEGPVLAYCRSGTRSITLWAQDQILHKGADVEDIITAAANAGYNLSGLRG